MVQIEKNTMVYGNTTIEKNFAGARAQAYEHCAKILHEELINENNRNNNE